MKNLIKNPFERKQKDAVVTLCMMCMLFFFMLLASGCREKADPQKMDEESFLKNLESAPSVTVSKNELPDWVNRRIDDLIISYVESPMSRFYYAEIFRGEWDKRTVYYITHSLSSCALCFYDEKGERILLQTQEDHVKFYTISKNWELIFQVLKGIVTVGDCGTKSRLSAYNTKIVDKYKFPDLSHMNDWMRPTIIQERLAALQIPDNVLATISTEGLLETCLEFPYLIDIFHSKDFQQGFNGLVKKFNGFREILKRPDLTSALIEKYDLMSLDVEGVQSLNAGKGLFSFRHFVLEYILAQDVVLENLNEEQERKLFLLSLEHTKIKSNCRDIFSNLNDVPTILLYAKKALNDNQASADMKNVLTEFLQSPVYVEQHVIDYLYDYVNVKFK